VYKTPRTFIAIPMETIDDAYYFGKTTAEEAPPTVSGNTRQFASRKVGVVEQA